MMDGPVDLWHLDECSSINCHRVWIITHRFLCHFLYQMDPVQKAVINHTFGVPLVKTKRPVISCNVCQIRFNSEVQKHNKPNTYTVFLPLHISISHVALDMLYLAVCTHSLFNSYFCFRKVLEGFSICLLSWEWVLTEDVVHLFGLCFGSCDPIGI